MLLSKQPVEGLMQTHEGRRGTSDPSQHWPAGDICHKPVLQTPWCKSAIWKCSKIKASIRWPWSRTSCRRSVQWLMQFHARLFYSSAAKFIVCSLWKGWKNSARRTAINTKRKLEQGKMLQWLDEYFNLDTSMTMSNHWVLLFQMLNK